MSIRKRVFTNDGKVYLLNEADNNAILYNLLQDKVEDTISLNEHLKQDAYTIFGKDTDAYAYYKNGIERKIPDELCTIKDIAVERDTLYLSVSNYFFTLEVKPKLIVFSPIIKV